MVNEDFQNYRCFGCGEHGDILSFAQHTHTISLFEALRMLAEEKNIEIDIKKSNQENSQDINGIREVIEEARLFYRKNYDELDNSHPAKQEVIKRGLDVNNPIYGYSLEAPNELYKHLKSKGHSDENIKDSQLVLFYEDRQPWDFFHGRLMITLSDYLGRPISFTSRKIFEDDKMKGKYVNGKESPVYIKKSMLFGADVAKQEARTKRKIYVVEGQFDQIAMNEKGIKNVVATSGTAFTQDHASLLLRMVGNNGEIVFIMDGDEAGVKAAESIFLTQNILHTKASAVHLEDGKDPCDYILEGGIQHLKEKIDKSSLLHDFVIANVLDNMGGTININNRQQFVQEVARFAKHSNTPHIIDSMLNKASIMSAISIDNVKEIFNKVELNERRQRNIETSKEKTLNIQVKLNADSEADKCMFTALSLLIRMPDKLIEETPKTIHSKFRPFLKEMGAKYSSYQKKGEKWRFIAEDYTDSDFARALQNRKFLIDPKDDVDSSVSQYKFLFERANEIYKREYESMKRAKALSSIVDKTDPKEIAEALKLYSEMKEKSQ